MAILTSANRLQLMPFAQMATRLGGAYYYSCNSFTRADFVGTEALTKMLMGILPSASDASPNASSFKYLASTPGSNKASTGLLSKNCGVKYSRRFVKPSIIAF